jgi:hypothetical protein
MNTNSTDSSKNDRNRKWQTIAKMTETSTHSVFVINLRKPTKAPIT